jgi:hypothetical protein
LARVVRLSALFQRRLTALGIKTGTAERAAVGATIGALAEAEELPGLFDTLAPVPPTGTAFVRRVGGRNLWLWYRVLGEDLVLVTVTRAPPVPIT